MPAMTIRSLAGGRPSAPSALEVIMCGKAMAPANAFRNDRLDAFISFIPYLLLIARSALINHRSDEIIVTA
jgi:hypothetical protein